MTIKCGECQGRGEIEIKEAISVKTKTLKALMGAVISIDHADTSHVQLIRNEVRPIIDDSGADLVERDGAMVTEGGGIVRGTAFELRFNVWDRRG